MSGDKYSHALTNILNYNISVHTNYYYILVVYPSTKSVLLHSLVCFDGDSRCLLSRAPQ